MKSITPDDIDAILPQTQCGLCGYGGCMPYAEALAYENAPINLCPPGGITTLKKLGALLEQNHIPFIADMEEKSKPPMLAVVREAECIGCTKCIQACPVDAILGGTKQMHTVIANECTGCELCVPVCPVDCIDMLALASEQANKTEQYRERFRARENRLRDQAEEKRLAKLGASTVIKKNYIEEARKRAAERKATTKKETLIKYKS